MGFRYRTPEEYALLARRYGAFANDPIEVPDISVPDPQEEALMRGSSEPADPGFMRGGVPNTKGAEGAGERARQYPRGVNPPTDPSYLDNPPREYGEMPRGADMPSDPNFLRGGNATTHGEGAGPRALWHSDQYRDAMAMPVTTTLGPVSYTPNPPRGHNTAPREMPTPAPEGPPELRRGKYGVADPYEAGVSEQVLRGHKPVLQITRRPSDDGLAQNTPPGSPAAARLNPATAAGSPASSGSSGSASPSATAQEEPPSRGMGWLARDLGALGGTLYMAGNVPRHGGQAMVEAGQGILNRAVQGNAQAEEQYKTDLQDQRSRERARQSAARQTAYDTRQAKLDAQTEEDRHLERLSRTEQDRIRREEHDPNSEWNKQKRDLEAEKEQGKQTALISAEDRRLANAEKLAAAKDKITHPGRGKGGPAKPFDMGATEAMVKTAYPDGPPPDVTAAMDLIKNSDAKHRTALVAKFNELVGKDKRAATAQKPAAPPPKPVSVGERNLFAKQNEGPESALVDYDRTDKLLQSVGVDIENYHGEPIPGMGRFEQHMPNIAISGKAQAMRQQMRANVSSMVRALSGLAASDQERAYIASIEGAADNMDEAALIDGLKRLKDISVAQRKRAAAYAPNAAAEYYKNQGQQNPIEPAAPAAAAPAAPKAAGKIRFRDPKTGRTGTADTLEEIKAAGYEALQ